ncbi:MAG: phage baseplate assembly protein V [Actinomycetota bacterium]|nr:phage baseplate assembly protein V [Actinomycetota bacterium]
MADAITLSPRVSVGGSALTSVWQAALLEVRVERALNVPGRATLRFVDPGYALLDSGVVSLGAELDVAAPGGPSALFHGIVTALGCDQREGEQPELVVVGYDRSYELGLTSQVKTWSQVTVSSVLRDLVSSSGLRVSGDSVGPSAQASLDYLLQLDTDLGLLGELARRRGADWWVDGATLCFGKPDELSARRATVKLTLGDGLLSFSARALPVPEKVSVIGWDPAQQQTVTGVATSASSGVLPSSSLAGKAHPSASFVAAALGARSAEEASTLSQALFDLRAAAAVEATGTAAGDGAIAPGGRATVSGAGPLSGEYPLSAVEHVYRPRRGFVTRFWSGDRRPAGLVEDSSRGSGSGVKGSIVGHHGLTAGIVTNINDPTRQGRVKVLFAGMSKAQESAWARIVATGGGAARGNVFIPEVGDEVLVAFEDGDTRVPLVLGGLYGSQSTIPPPDVADGKVQKRELVSRLGHTVRLLDGEATDQKAIELVLAGGLNAVHLGADKTTVTVQKGKALSITVGSTAITVAQGTGEVSIKAPSISLQADQQIQLQAPTVTVNADTSLELKSQMSASLQGLTVELQAEASMQVTGTPVMING